MATYSELVKAYLSQGWSCLQARNIAAVQVAGESGGSLGTGGPDVARGGGNGISQWSAKRWRELLAWTAAHGLDPRSLAGQTGFTTFELRGKYSNVDTNSIADIVNRYESPRTDLRPAEIARSQRQANFGVVSHATGAGGGAIGRVLHQGISAGAGLDLSGGIGAGSISSTSDQALATAYGVAYDPNTAGMGAAPDAGYSGFQPSVTGISDPYSGGKL